MYNRDEVIKQAALAASENASEVRSALTNYVHTQTTETELALRVALVAQATGHESMSHDGCTYQARKAAAAAAIAAWDGAGDFKFYVAVGESRLGTNDVALLRLLNFESPYSNDETRTARPMSGTSNSAIAEIAQALSEGLRGEHALLRALALKRTGKGQEPTGAELRSIEDQRLHVARVERQAAILRARAAGLSNRDIESIVR